MELNKELFTNRMRKATRELHAISDAMVNAKLLIALSDDSVWAEGLLIFYEIFRYLEIVMLNCKNENLKELCIYAMFRTVAFEEDLKHYLGENWRNSYVIRDSVTKYLVHLQHLESTDPDMLMAYVYHLYMGLLSGGQVLRKKRSLMNKFRKTESWSGESVTDFGESKIADLKKELKNTMNSVADSLSEETQVKLIEESKTVFLLNNSIIKTVKGTNKVVLYKCFYWFCVFIGMYMFIKFLSILIA